MTEITPSSYALALGLSPGIDGTANSEDLTDVENSVRMKQIVEIGNLSTTKEEQFWAEVTSAYLPALLRSHSEAALGLLDPALGDLDEVHGSRAVFSFTTTCCTQLESALDSAPSWERFVRLHPTEALNVLIAHLEAMSIIPVDNFRVIGHPESTVYMMWMMAILHPLYLLSPVLSPSLVERGQVGPLSSETKSALATRLGLLLTATPFFQQLDPEKSLKAIKMMTFLQKRRWDVESLSSDGSEWELSTSRPWLVCELTRREAGAVSACQVQGEMKACSRCVSVRYCCREHQRLDWKHHKHLCFEPGW